MNDTKKKLLAFLLVFLWIAMILNYSLLSISILDYPTISFSLLLFSTSLLLFLSSINTYKFPSLIQKLVVWFQNNKSSSYAILFLILIVIIVQYKSILTFGWNDIDDHEIITYLGGKPNLGWNEFFPVLLSKTDLAMAGDFMRFRPVYAILRVLETTLWGSDLHLWYLSRMVILCFSVYIFWETLRRKIGSLLSGAILLYTFLSTYWIEIFAGLGASETYAVFGIAIFLWGFSEFLGNSSKLRNYHWIAMSLGYIICVGAKENFIILFPVMLYLLVFSIKLANKNIFPFISIVISSLFSLWVVTVIIIANHVNKEDIYFRSTTVLDRFELGVSKLSSVEFLVTQIPLWTLVAIGVYLLIFVLFWKKYHPDEISSFTSNRNAALFFVVLLAIYLSQLYIYNFDWPTGGRYSFPGLLIIPLSFVVIYQFFTESIGPSIAIDEFKIGMKTGFSVLIIIMLFVGRFVEFNSAMHTRISKDEAIRQTINQMVTLIDQHPDFPVLIEGNNVWDYEIFHAWPTIFNFNGAPAQYFIELHINPEGLNNGDKKLLYRIVAIAQNGNDLISPIDEFDASPESCISLLRNGNDLPFCNYYVNIP